MDGRPDGLPENIMPSPLIVGAGAQPNWHSPKILTDGLGLIVVSVKVIVLLSTLFMLQPADMKSKDGSEDVISLYPTGRRRCDAVAE